MMTLSYRYFHRLTVLLLHLAYVLPGGSTRLCVPYPLCSPSSTPMNVQPSPFYTATFNTSEGLFRVYVNTSWAPHASQRFYNLVRLGWYNDTYFFRVIKGFVNEFGLSGQPSLQAHYCNDLDCSQSSLDSGAAIKSDLPIKTGAPSNTFGTIAFSLQDTGGNASVEVYINLGNNSRLDSQFVPFGTISMNDMDIVEQIYAGYGELNQSNICQHPKKELCKGPKLSRILQEGNNYLSRNFPKMSLTYNAWVSH
eukprot:m.344465 g.344465  ORF g.344465 m.344465 type:complete len:252 (-) comp24494_c0_seq1:153-908(-)